jgi:serine/threonine-protein kinase
MTLSETEEMLGEAILLSQIGHPNIVRVFDANVIEMSAGLSGYFTMELVPGGSLDKFWHSHGAKFVPVETTVDILKQVCRGLAVAHAEQPPVIHRDIKPQNILVGYEADGLRARLSDFGLARKANPLTLLASAAGTLMFKPPETFEDPKADSRAADIWAMGVTAYLLLTDNPPYEVDPTLGWGNRAAFEKKPPMPSEWNVEVDGGLDAIVMRCLDFDVGTRYPSAREMLAALEGWRQPATIRSPLRKKNISSAMSKSVFGAFSPANTAEAQRLAQTAIRKAREEGRLLEAADIMEEAFNKSPLLREKYASKVKQWRCGISM